MTFNVWFQKISIPPPRRELEILEGGGGGGQRPREFRRGAGLSVKLHFQMVKFDAVTTQFENHFLSTLQTFYIK